MPSESQPQQKNIPHSALALHLWLCCQPATVESFLESRFAILWSPQRTSSGPSGPKWETELKITGPGFQLQLQSELRKSEKFRRRGLADGRGWREEILFLYHRFKPLFCNFFPIPHMRRGTQFRGPFWLYKLGPASRPNPLPPTPFRNFWI